MQILISPKNQKLRGWDPALCIRIPASDSDAFLKLTDTDLILCLFFFFKIFLMWTVFKLFIEFVTILLPFYVLFFGPEA